MKRYALAGTFALLAGVATLLLLVSILYSCQMGGHPHDMGNSSRSGGSSHSSSARSPTPQVVVTDQVPAARRNSVAPSTKRL